MAILDVFKHLIYGSCLHNVFGQLLDQSKFHYADFPVTSVTNP